MSVDMLDFEPSQLYFDEPLGDEVNSLLHTAAERYGDAEAEQALLSAYFLAPEHPMVLVALYRYFYYQHRFEDAMRIADRVLKIYAERLSLPEDWHELDRNSLGVGVMVSMSMVRFYMLALKGKGYLYLRLGEYDDALACLRKVERLDSNDRLGAGALRAVAEESLGRQSTSAVSNGN